MTALAAIGIALAAYFVWVDIGRFNFGVDDADIFFVYAHNILRGHGIVYSVGFGHVYGATSLLYLLVCCLVWLLFPRPETALFFFNFLCVTVECALVFNLFSKICRKLNLPAKSMLALSGVFLLWLLLNPSFFVWAIVALMDEGLYSLLITLAFTLLAGWAISKPYRARSESILLSTVIVLTVVARPEGVAWGLLEAALFALLIFHPEVLRSEDQAAARKLWFVPGVIAICTYAASLGFSKAYFGYPLPNTYYAKVTGDRLKSLHDGVHYFHLFLKFYGIFLFLPLLITLACLLIYRRDISRPLMNFSVITLAFLFLGLTLPILEGGEHFGSFRMYQAIYPMFCVCAILPALLLLRKVSWSSGLAVVCVLALLYGLTTQSTWPQFRRANDAMSEGSMRQGFILTAETRKDGQSAREVFAPHLPVVGIGAAGGFAYAYDGPALDMLGLNDVRMAHADPIKVGVKDHASFNAGVFYSESPDILAPQCQSSDTPLNLARVEAYYLDPLSFDSQVYKGIFATQKFQSKYQLAAVRSAAHPEITCSGFFRKDYLRQIVDHEDFNLVDSIPSPSLPK